MNGFRRGPNANHVAQQENNPCVTLIFRRSIVPPSVSTGCSRCLIRLRQPEGGQTYPPYNIERTGEDSYRISMAVAGFSDEEISIEAHRNVLTVKGERKEETNGEGTEVLYRGIAARSFERRFQLADHVDVVGAALKNGLLHIDLKRNIPEELKPRKIAITRGGSDKPPSRSKPRRPTKPLWFRQSGRRFRAPPFYLGRTASRFSRKRSLEKVDAGLEKACETKTRGSVRTI